MSETIKIYLRQRRIWAGIVVFAGIILSQFHLNYIPDADALTDLLTNLGVAIANFIDATYSVIAGALAVWSYFKPKQI